MNRSAETMVAPVGAELSEQQLKEALLDFIQSTGRRAEAFGQIAVMAPDPDGREYGLGTGLILSPSTLEIQGQFIGELEASIGIINELIETSGGLPMRIEDILVAKGLGQATSDPRSKIVAAVSFNPGTVTWSIMTQSEILITGLGGEQLIGRLREEVGMPEPLALDSRYPRQYM